MYRLIEINRTQHGVRCFIERPDSTIYCDWFFPEHTNKELKDHLRQNGVYTGGFVLETISTIE